MSGPWNRQGIPSLLGLAGLVLAGLALAAPGNLDPSPQAWSRSGGALALAGILVELAALRLPGFGFFSTGFAFWFALALQPPPAPQIALLGGGGALAIRCMLRGGPGLEKKARETLAELIPLTAGLAFLAWTPPGTGVLPLLAGGGAYLLAAALVPGLLLAGSLEPLLQDRGRLQARLLPLLASLPALGLLLALLGRQQPELLGVLAALVAAIGYAGWLGASWERQELPRRLQRRLAQANLKREQAELEHHQASRELAGKVDEAALLEHLSESLTGCKGVARTAQEALALVRRLVGCRSAVLFVAGADGLLPLAWESPDPERLASWRLLGLSDPVVERAWQSGRSVRARPDEPSWDPAVPAEGSRLAVPVATLGVLLVGSPQPEAFSQTDLQRLEMVAKPLARALESARSLEDLAGELSRQRLANQRLEGWAAGLERAMQGMPGLLGSLDPEELQDTLLGLLAEVIPHEVLVLSTPERLLVRGQADPEASLPLVEATCRNRRPLLLEEVSESRFAPPGPGIRSVLAVPLDLEDQRVGALVLGSSRSEAFQRFHQDLAWMLASQAGVALQKAGLHRELLATHRALQESQAHLVQSSKLAAVGQLAAGVAHELNTPLGAILLGVDSALASLETRPERAAARLQTARRAALQARQTVAKLLFYSREAGQGMRATDLNQVVTDTLELVGHHLEVEKIQVEWCPGQLGPVQANPNELQQVLTNLVLNARDALRQTEGDRTLRLASRGEGGWSVIEVVDGGPGIPPEIQERLCEPFFTTKPVGQGTGLGLWVSREILNRHQGSLRMDSVPGRTCFTMRLPASSSACGTGEENNLSEKEGPPEDAKKEPDLGPPRKRPLHR